MPMSVFEEFPVAKIATEPVPPPKVVSTAPEAVYRVSFPRLSSVPSEATRNVPSANPATENTSSSDVRERVTTPSVPNVESGVPSASSRLIRRISVGLSLSSYPENLSAR